MILQYLCLSLITAEDLLCLWHSSRRHSNQNKLTLNLSSPSMIFLSSLTVRKARLKCQFLYVVIRAVHQKFPRFSNFVQAQSWRVLFFGNDLFSLESLKSLKNQQESKLITRLEVVTSATRDNPVGKYASINNIPVHNWPYNSGNIESYDLGVVASFGYLIPKDIISKFPLGIINVHASLLPRWRGASPVSYAILHGDKMTGVTIMKIKPHRFDVGEILSQSELNIEENDSFITLLKRLSILGASELKKCIENLPQILEAAKPQDTVGVTNAPKIKKELAELNFEAMDATAIYRLERAVSHLFPLTTYWFDTPVKLLTVRPSTCSAPTESVQPGRIYYNKKTKKINVLCCARTYITFSNVVIGNRLMSSHDFYNGFLSKVPEKQWFFKFSDKL